jgi:hypothetical protein
MKMQDPVIVTLVPLLDIVIVISPAGRLKMEKPCC